MNAVDVSADGNVVVGWLRGGGGGFRWTEAGGVQPLGAPAGATVCNPRAVSANGSVIVGEAIVTGVGTVAFKWQNGTFTTLPALWTSPEGTESNHAMAVSADGSVVAGYGDVGQFVTQAIRWSPAPQALGLGVGGDHSAGYGISPDGSVVVGKYRLADPPINQISAAFRSVGGGGIASLGTDGYLESQAWGASAGGARIVGALTSTYLGPTAASYWTEAGGWKMLQGTAGSSVAYDISNDGSMIVGMMWPKAFFWEEETGAVDLQQYLVDEFNTDFGGMTLTQATGIDSGGTVIVGMGMVGVNQQGWRVKLPLRVKRPAKNEKVEVAKPDTIRWKGDHRNGWEVFLSQDNGATYTRLDTILAPERRELIWTWSDTLRSSDLARIKVADAVDGQYYAESKPFRMRGWDLVRIESGGSYSPFSPFTNVWGFGNNDPAIWSPAWWSTRYDYQSGTDPFTSRPYPQSLSAFRNSAAGEYPSWPSFVGAFGEAECYNGFPLNLLMTYDYSAPPYWEENSTPYKGACYGLAASSLLIFYHESVVRSRFPLLPPAGFLSGLAVDSTVREMVAQYFITQKGDAQMARRLSAWGTSPKDVFYRLRESFLSDDHWDKNILNFFYASPNPGVGGGHTVLPYQVRGDPSDVDKVRIYVYDSNNPLSDKIYIEVDTAANTWRELNFGWPALPDGMYLDVSMETMLAQPEIPSIPPGIGPTAASAAGESTPGPGIRLFNSEDAAVVITAPGGDSIGCTWDAAFSTIAGAIPLIPLTGTPQRAEGYLLPASTYSVKLGGFRSGRSRLTVFEPGSVYRFSRSDADSAQEDAFSVGDGFGYRSGGAEPKSVTLSAMMSFGSAGLEYVLSSIVPGEDSLHLRTSHDGSLTAYAPPGGELMVDIALTRMAPGSLTTFTHAGLSFPRGASVRFAAADDSLASLLAFVDSSSDGLVEDTVILANQLTDVAEWVGDGLPGAFRLSQNYPNPFNPSTEIRFALPERMMVSLKVYDVLGREVATLVDSEQEAGHHSVRWDASNAPAAIYVYRLKAGGSFESRKMVLLK